VILQWMCICVFAISTLPTSTAHYCSTESDAQIERSLWHGRAVNALVVGPVVAVIMKIVSIKRMGCSWHKVSMVLVGLGCFGFNIFFRRWLMELAPDSTLCTDLRQDIGNEDKWMQLGEVARRCVAAEDFALRWMLAIPAIMGIEGLNPAAEKAGSAGQPTVERNDTQKDRNKDGYIVEAIIMITWVLPLMVGLNSDFWFWFDLAPRVDPHRTSSAWQCPSSQEDSRTLRDEAILLYTLVAVLVIFAVTSVLETFHNLKKFANPDDDKKAALLL